MRSVSFTVYGHPAPQGSSRAFVPKGWTRAIVTSTNPKLKPWRQEVAGAAKNLDLECLSKDAGVKIVCHFFFDRPASVSKKKRPYMTVKPDVDKLLRAILDSLKGILIQDDCQVIDARGRKFYGSPERVEITVSEECE